METHLEAPCLPKAEKNSFFLDEFPDFKEYYPGWNIWTATPAQEMIYIYIYIYYVCICMYVSNEEHVPYLRLFVKASPPLS